MVHLATGSEKSNRKLRFWQVVIRIIAMLSHASRKADTIMMESLIRMIVHMDAMTCIHVIIDAILQLLRLTEES